MIAQFKKDCFQFFTKDLKEALRYAARNKLRKLPAWETEMFPAFDQETVYFVPNSGYDFGFPLSDKDSLGKS